MGADTAQAQEPKPDGPHEGPDGARHDRGGGTRWTVAAGLRRRLRCVAVEPTESAVLSGHPFGADKIDGIGAGYLVPLWHDGIADEIERVSTADAKATACRLAQEEDLFCGSSTGANVTVPLRLAERSRRDATIVTIMCDTGLKYPKAFSEDLKL
jgi:cysteine synthase A